MARSHFAGTSVDWLLRPYRFGGTTLMALKSGTTILDFYSAQTGGTHYTDLLDSNGNAASQIAVTDYQIPSFQGPDAILAMWADKGDGSPREYIEAQDLAAAASAVTTAAASATAAAASAASAAAAATAAVAGKVDKAELPYISAARPTGADMTATIQAELDAHTDVFVSVAGTYVINGTVQLDGGGKRLTLANGVTLNRPAASANTEPVIWMRGNFDALVGAGKHNSLITTELASPIGVVCVGYKGVSDSTARNSSYNTLCDFGIVGKQAGGETSGNPSFGLYLCNRSLSGTASYFQSIHDLYISNANVGLMMHGYSDAHLIRGIHFVHCGDEKYLDGAAVKLSVLNSTEVPLDNAISQIFHHTSPNAVTVYLDGPVIYNNLTDIMAEQSGATAQFLKNNDDTAAGNNITGLDNVSGGTNLTANFLKKNSYTRRGEIYAKKATLVDLVVTGLVTLGGGTPVVTAGAGAGTSPPTPTLTAESTDLAGTVLAGTGTSPAAGFIVHVAFSTAFATIPKTAVAVAGNLGTAPRQVYVANLATTGFDIGLGTAPNASQSVGVYRLQYSVST